MNGRFSPDGRWIAYSSTESGRAEIYVREFPKSGGGTAIPISRDGGAWAVWSNDGHSLFFEAPDHRIMVADYKSQGKIFTANKPRLWSDVRVRDLGGNRAFALHPDGQRFAISPADPPSPEERGNAHVTLLLNFGDELRRRAAAAK
jgi:serine/threonine-protein kinase